MNTLHDIQHLLDPQTYQQPIDINAQTPDILLHLLQVMLRIRKVEQCLAQQRQAGIIGGPVHLGAGQEAIAVGISQYLQKTDRIFGAHRSHAHLLALNASIHKLFAEVLGKVTGHSKGMGGSMHLWDRPNGFYGSVPIVAGTVSLAVGAGLAAKMQQTDDIAVAYLGDGAVEEGVVHESLNLAHITQIPILFVVENNLFSSHMHISERQPRASTARFAVANDIPHQVIDGNDVIAVAKAANRLIEKARKEKTPVFLEAFTFRHYGHVDWREDIDVGVNRSQQDLQAWKKRDPILRLQTALIEARLWDEQQIGILHKKLDSEISNAWQEAIDDPYPPTESLLRHTYA